jgi:hypothetical protein
VIAADTFKRLINLIGLGLGFLQQNAVRIKLSERFSKTFALHGTDTVNIPGDYFHVDI